MSKIDIRSLTFSELDKEFNNRNYPRFRTAQVYDWLQAKGVMSFDEMTNLSRQLRQELDADFEIKSCNIIRKLVSKIDGTDKYLFEDFFPVHVVPAW